MLPEVERFRVVRQNTIAVLDELTDEQAMWIPGRGSWSIAQISDHLLTTEEMYRSQFARLISLSVRLFANILAGHLLLLFMGGGLAVLLGLAALAILTFPLAFFFLVLELGLIATLQAFIFATLTAIYLGTATSEEGH